jgi:tetratricopeptide (TPR) repeat protein
MIASIARLADPALRMLRAGLPAGALLLAALLAASLAACDRPQPAPPTALPAEPAPRVTAPLYEGMGRATLVAQANPVAQRYFAQAMQLAYGFDFAEADRAFAAALALDPQCALCAWGRAYVNGPNINHVGREPDTRLQAAQRYVEQARALAANTTPRERALIEALARRLEVPPSGAAPAAAALRVSESPPLQVCGPAGMAEPHPADLGYAEAMERLARAHVDDPDIGALYAEALLMLAPWQWWRGDVPQASTARAIDVLTAVLARTPDHAGANHFLIHAYEQSPEPERALGAAARLPALAPSIGHLVHMPAHIHLRLGRYADAVRANEAAVAADAALAQQAHAQGLAPPAGRTHHLHFLWSSSALMGKAGTALDAASLLARDAASASPAAANDGNRDYFLALPYFALVRFGRWDEIMALPAPDAGSVYADAMWHWARGMAHARQGRAKKALDELAELEGRIADANLDDKLLKGIDELREFLEIAAASLRGEALLAAKRYGPALEAFGRATALEDALESEEPPPWAYSTRVALGSAQLLANRPKDAEASFREDLKRYPHNGWALYGLAEALRRQGRRAEAAALDAGMRSVWPTAQPRPDTRY